jgi:hypothetical protein
MKIKHILLFAFTIITFFGFSQNKFGPITLSYGEEIIEDKEKIVRIAGEANGKVYTLATKGKKFFIKVFDAVEMKHIVTNEIVFPELKGRDLDFEDFTVLNNKIFALGSLYDRKNKEFTLMALEISEDGTITSNKKKLFQAKVTKKRERGAFYFKDSPAQDKLLIMHASLFEKEDVMQYEIKLIDENLTILASHLERVSFTDRRDLEFTIADFDISQNDDIFLVINESYRDKKKKENVEKFEIHAFKKGNSYKKEVVNVNFKDKEVINCEMLITQNNLLQIVGFYSSVKKSGRANWKLKGVYAGTIDTNSNTVTSLKFNEFDYDTKVKLIGERRAKKDKDVLPYYSTHSLIEKDDGGLILLAEYRLVFIGRTQGIGPIGVTPITYTTNEIIVTSLNPDGSVEWANVIAKKQRASFSTVSVGLFGFAGNSNFSVGVGISIPIGVLGKGPEYLGAIPIYEDGQLTVVFNDNKKNIGVTDIEEIKWLGNYNKAIPAALMFSDTGEITRLDSEEIQKDQLIMRPGVFYRSTAKDYLIYASKRSQDKLGRMKID